MFALVSLLVAGMIFPFTYTETVKEPVADSYQWTWADYPGEKPNTVACK